MHVIDRKSVLWSYLQEDIKGLIVDGEIIIDHLREMSPKISDYAFVVFPFAKAYEGFLKRLFLDLRLIKEDEYYGDEIRIGRILNPRYIHEEQNVFNRVCGKTDKKGSSVGDLLWATWRLGRNQLFHYFPHNYKRITLDEAYDIVRKIVEAMELVVTKCSIKM